MEDKKSFLDNINHFRGIAIIFIVFSHCMSFGILHFKDNTSLLAELIKYLVPGGTYFFVFISGYLLYYVHGEEFHLKSFLTNKIKYIVLPFLLFASLDILYFLTQILFSYLISSNNYLRYLVRINEIDLVKIYLLGDSSMTIGLWYVPFIMVVFVLSKVFIKIVKLKLNVQSWIITFFYVCSLIIHRADCDCVLGILQNVIHFTPVFLLGIFLASNREVFHGKFLRNAIFFLVLTCFVLLLQVKIGDMENFNKFDLMIFQKTTLSIFFVLFLHNFGDRKIKILTVFASNSFGIFFIHGFFIWLINALVLKFNITLRSSSIVIYIFNANLVLLLSLYTAILIRRFIGVRSKYLIGC